MFLKLVLYGVADLGTMEVDFKWQLYFCGAILKIGIKILMKCILHINILVCLLFVTEVRCTTGFSKLRGMDLSVSLKDANTFLPLNVQVVTKLPVYRNFFPYSFFIPSWLPFYIITSCVVWGRTRTCSEISGGVDFPALGTELRSGHGHQSRTKTHTR